MTQVEKTPTMHFHFVPFLQCVTQAIVHVKDLESQKGQSPHQQKLLSPTENTAPETPRQWSRF